jgi:glycosyltransferase involved in cell wall biosynthesis
MISAIIPVLNEENRLEPCLQSLQGWCDEVVIVDNGSTDDTVALAEQYECKVVAFKDKYPYMGPHRIFGISHANGDWLVQLDADERVPEALGKKFRQIADKGHYAGVRVARKNIILGRWLRHGGMWRVDQLKLYSKTRLTENQNPYRMHWEPEIYGPILHLPRCEEYSVVHVPFDCFDSVVRRFAGHYDIGESRTLFADGRRFCAFQMILRPLRRFLMTYFYRFGFLDGIPGFLFAIMLTLVTFLAEARLYDHLQKNANGPASKESVRHPIPTMKVEP